MLPISLLLFLNTLKKPSPLPPFSTSLTPLPLPQARTHLETLIEASANFHALTFNLSTIYELCTERSRVLKIGLAEKVAEMQIEGLGSDGAEEGAEGGSGKSGWEKVNGDFKL